jgi:hypothetical protein
MTQKFIGTSRQAQRTAADTINSNFSELYASSGTLATIKPITANYTLVVDDSSQVLRVSSATAVTITLPVDLPVGFQVAVIQAGAGQITFAPASGVTIYSRGGYTKTAGQHAIVSLLVTTAGGYNFSGDAAA